MRLWDDKDRDLIAETINRIGPDSVSARADLIVAAAIAAMVFPADLEKAIARHRK